MIVQTQEQNVPEFVLGSLIIWRNESLRQAETE